MDTQNWIALGALITSLVVPYFVSIKYQERQEKKRARLQLFLSLMKYRRNLGTPHPEFVNALNQIDALFHDRGAVRRAWEKYFESLHPTSVFVDQNPTFLVDLLHAIAQDLKFHNFQPTDLTRLYTPQGYTDIESQQLEVAKEVLRVFSASEHFGSPRTISPQTSL